MKTVKEGGVRDSVQKMELSYCCVTLSIWGNKDILLVNSALHGRGLRSELYAFGCVCGRHMCECVFGCFFMDAALRC